MDENAALIEMLNAVVLALCRRGVLDPHELARDIAGRIKENPAAPGRLPLGIARLLVELRGMPRRRWWW